MEQSLREDVTAREILYLLSIQSAEIGLVENQPNTSIKKKRENEPRKGA